MSKDFRYLAVLCLGAIAILVAGILLRPEKAAAPIPSESDLLQLQLSAQRVQRAEADRLGATDKVTTAEGSTKSRTCWSAESTSVDVQAFEYA